MTIHPETQVSASWHDLATDEFVYVIGPKQVRIPARAFKDVVPGRLGIPARRAILAQALEAQNG